MAIADLLATAPMKYETDRHWLEMETQRYAINMGLGPLRLDQLDLSAIDIALLARADLETVRQRIQTAILTAINPAAVGM